MVREFSSSDAECECGPNRGAKITRKLGVDLWYFCFVHSSSTLRHNWRSSLYYTHHIGPDKDVDVFEHLAHTSYDASCVGGSCRRRRRTFRRPFNSVEPSAAGHCVLGWLRRRSCVFNVRWTDREISPN